ncbi:odorant receptor 49a-like [Neodiprion fabricii]|uniref:odorant receptor 49a-like n=1 Tax=Neodiprion fabricii TaxID=2872261 RepID=UPI001ED90B2F|nr:odorant receptor 49a-like [Neodiprion fabricii]
MSGQTAFWDHFWLAKFLLQFAGILPIGGSSALWKSVLTEFLATLPLWASFYLLIPEVQYICCQNPSVDGLLEALVIISAVLTGQFRSVFVMVYRHRIMSLFLICETMWEEADLADRKIMLPWVKLGKIISTVFFYGANCVVAMHILNTVVKQISAPANSTTKFYPFIPEEDSTPSPQYEIKYTLQTIISYIGVSYIAACDMTGTILSFNMCGHFAVVRSWLLELSKENFDEADGNSNASFQEGLKKCIRRHQIVLELCAELEDVNQYNYIIQIVTEMYIMAISAAEFTKLQNFGSLQHLITFLLAINGLFFSCWPADTLSVESSNIAQVVYGVPWYQGSRSERIMVAVMLARSQRPATLSAAKFVVLSLETFSSITSSGISLCMLLSSF